MVTLVTLSDAASPLSLSHSIREEREERGRARQRHQRHERHHAPPVEARPDPSTPIDKNVARGGWISPAAVQERPAVGPVARWRPARSSTDRCLLAVSYRVSDG